MICFHGCFNPWVFVCGLKNQITGLSLFQNAPIVFDTDRQALSLSLTPLPLRPHLSFLLQSHPEGSETGEIPGWVTGKSTCHLATR